MKKTLLTFTLALLISGCAQQTFTVENKPTTVTPKETITHHFFVSGIGQKKTVDAAKICGGADKVVKAYRNPANIRKWIARFIYLGIYTPLEASGLLLTIITCAAHQYGQFYLHC
ncbi:Bor/Iss family lipoprotein [Escherichia coli]